MNSKKNSAPKLKKPKAKKKPEDPIPPDGACKNCGTVLTGAYCHQCGQRADEPRRVVVGLVQDFLVDTLAIDGKLARSIGLLLWRPGRLARRYLDGKRVTYSPPFRLYLFASVFFFLLAFALIGAPKPLGDSVAINGDGEVTLNEQAIEEVEAVDPEAAARLREANAALKDKAQRAVKDQRLFFAQSKENLPRVMLLAPVFYALILLLLYFYRRKFFVYDHFVVSLYMHAALYSYLLLALLLSFIPGIGPLLAAVPLIWGWLQPFAVLRQAYGSNWFSAFVKWAISIIVYFALLVIIITLGFSVSLYQS